MASPNRQYSILFRFEALDSRWQTLAGHQVIDQPLQIQLPKARPRPVRAIAVSRGGSRVVSGLPAHLGAGSARWCRAPDQSRASPLGSVMVSAADASTAMGESGAALVENRNEHRKTLPNGPRRHLPDGLQAARHPGIPKIRNTTCRRLTPPRTMPKHGFTPSVCPWHHAGSRLKGPVPPSQPAPRPDQRSRRCFVVPS